LWAADQDAVHQALDSVVQSTLALGEQDALFRSLWLHLQQVGQEGATGDVDALAALLALLWSTCAEADLGRRVWKRRARFTMQSNRFSGSAKMLDIPIDI